MFKKILDGICLKLSEYYNYSIYIDESEQGFEEPCFFIQHIESSHQSKLNDRHSREYRFNVRFHNTKDGIEMLNTKGDELYQILEYIKTEEGQLVRGLNMEFEINDGVLHFFVTYKGELDSIKDSVEKMQHMDTKVGVEVGR